MRKTIIIIAQFFGLLSVVEYQNSKLGLSLMDKFEQAIEGAKIHSEKCNELAALKQKKAYRIESKAEEKAWAMEKKASIERHNGSSKRRELVLSSERIKSLGIKSASFAQNLSRLVG